jgi:hypothetical protein
MFDPKTPNLVKDIFQFTSRDNQSLFSDGHFGIAYQGNYMEELQALWEVIKFNGILPGLDILQDKGKTDK